eukprot:403334737
MVKKYTRVTDEQRRDMIKLIYEQNYTIKRAGAEVGIPYPNAKAVNQTYLLEKRTTKKTFRFRLKNVDIGKKIQRNFLPLEKNNLFENNLEEQERRTCGIFIFSSQSDVPSITRINRDYSIENDKTMIQKFLLSNIVLPMDPITGGYQAREINSLAILPIHHPTFHYSYFNHLQQPKIEQPPKIASMQSVIKQERRYVDEDLKKYSEGYKFDFLNYKISIGNKFLSSPQGQKYPLLNTNSNSNQFEQNEGFNPFGVSMKSKSIKKSEFTSRLRNLDNQFRHKQIQQILQLQPSQGMQ